MGDFAAQNGVALDKKVWIPGSLMSYGDVEAMLECIFLVNKLPGGKGHHDGHMKGETSMPCWTTPCSRPTVRKAPYLDCSVAPSARS